MDEVAELDRWCGGLPADPICRTTLVEDPEPALRWYFCIGEEVRRCIEPAELCDGDLRCLGCIEKLLIDEGLEECSPPNSELGVWLPNDLRVGICGESRTTCIEAPDERFEFTELERREFIDGRWPRWLLALPNFPFEPLPRRPVDIRV